MTVLRKDPIVGRWVIIATERGKRPYYFVSETKDPRGAFCTLCPGNEAKTPPKVYALMPEGSPPNTPGWQRRVFKKIPCPDRQERLEQAALTRLKEAGKVGSRPGWRNW